MSVWGYNADKDSAVFNRSRINPPPGGYPVYFQGLPEELNSDALKEYMEQIGQVLSLSVFKREGMSRNVAEVSFYSYKAAKRAVETIHLFRGQNHRCSFCPPVKQFNRQTLEEQIRTLFVKGVPTDYSEQDLLEVFFSVWVHRPTLHLQKPTRRE